MAGRYHANPWGRHVREAAVEWGPSPYRLIRAIIDTQFRKMPEANEEIMKTIISKLSSSLPIYHLPKASYSFMDIFVNNNKRGDPDRKEEIFDAFVVVNPSDPLFIKWEKPILSEDERNYLSKLLEKINYLGRSESWVKIELDDAPKETEWNSFPLNYKHEQTNLEEIRVAVPVPKEDYTTQNSKISWFNGLILRTEDLENMNIGNSPAMKFVNYYASSDRFTAKDGPYKIPASDSVLHEQFNSVLYEIESKLPPSIIDSVEVGNNIHRALMGKYKKITGNNNIPDLFSGRDQSGNPLKGHKHIFILPLDLNYDGVLDHVLIESKKTFNPDEFKTLNSFRTLWQRNGEKIRFIPLQFGMRDKIEFPLNVNRHGRVFLSETPVVLTRHYRKGRGDITSWIKSEIKHEALDQGLPEPISISFVPNLERNGRKLNWIEFRRSRNRFPEQIGYGFRIEFDEDLKGPISIGYGAHYGLGLFMPERDRK